jgi:hypothetical protein
MQEIVSEEQGAACAGRMIECRCAQLERQYDDSNEEENNNDDGEAESDETEVTPTTTTTMTMMLLPKGGGGGCGRKISVAQTLAVEGYFDAYRIASGGWMHHLDDRRWRMSKASLLRMRAEKHRIEVLLDHEMGVTLGMQAQLQFQSATSTTTTVVHDQHGAGEWIRLAMELQTQGLHRGGGARRVPSSSSLSLLSSLILLEEHEEEARGQEWRAMEARESESIDATFRIRNRLDEIYSVLMRQSRLSEYDDNNAARGEGGAPLMGPPMKRARIANHI